MASVPIRAARTIGVVVLGVVLAGSAGAADAPLVDAAKSSDAAAVRALVRRGINVNATTSDGTTALHWAASHGNDEIVALLLKAGAKARAANRYGVTPLSLACVSGNASVVERLLKGGARVTDALPGGEAPLMTAARTGNRDAIKVLVAHGADVNARETTRGQTALMWAAAEGRADAMRVLIEAGADVRARSKEIDFRNYAPMRGGSAIGDVANGVAIEFSPLLFAVRGGHIPAVRVLLDAGADVNEITPDGTSALVIAAINARWELGSYLLERGANPNAAAQGWNALHQVARTRTFNLGNVPHPQAAGSVSSLDFVKTLIERGVDINARVTQEIRNDGYRFGMSRLGATAFLIAAKGADAPMMRLLAERGADTTLVNDEGTTPLMAAAGVDLAFLGEDTGTHDDAWQAVQVALQYPHDVNAVNKEGNSALHGAARRGALPIVEALIARGASLQVRNKRGWTALTVALGYRNGKPLFLNEQRQLDAAAVIHEAMQREQIPIDEDKDALGLMRSGGGARAGTL